MCGLAGWVRGPHPAAMDLRGWRASLRHRGPDDTGWLVSDGVSLRSGGAGDLPESACSLALLHCRLSIIDVSAAGHQPMESADGRHFIVFNGEIYNYRELRAELSALGHVFRSQSDTEVLLTAFVQWGERALDRLVGMFAFAIHDRAQNTVFLARDPFGIKPLYFAGVEGGICFASEIKTLLALPGFSRRVAPQALYDYLRWGITDHGTATFFEEVQQLPAGHWMRLRVGSPDPRPVPYWTPRADRTADLSFEEAAAMLRELFLESVSLHLRSDVRVGAALSGGIDSSSIVMGMRAVSPELDLHAFSFIADDPRITEERWVDIVGSAAHATVHKVRASADEVVSGLDTLIKVQDEPFGSTSIYAQHRIFQVAQAAGVKVMLDGQGADELLGGYRAYVAARAASLARQQRWGGLIAYLIRVRRAGAAPLRQMVPLLAAYLLPPNLQERFRRATGIGAAPRWLRAGWFTERGASTVPHVVGRGPDVLRQHLLLSLRRDPLPHLLRYEDRNSMHVSIESRVPFLTVPLAEFLLALPEHYLVDNRGTTKAVFRAAMRGVVPDAVLDRRDKIGFATPEAEWLRAVTPYVEAALARVDGGLGGVLDAEGIRGEWQRVRTGRTPYDFRMWRWLNLLRWAEIFEVEFA